MTRAPKTRGLLLSLLLPFALLPLLGTEAAAQRTDPQYTVHIGGVSIGGFEEAEVEGGPLTERSNLTGVTELVLRRGEVADGLGGIQGGEDGTVRVKGTDGRPPIVFRFFDVAPTMGTEGDGDQLKEELTLRFKSIARASSPEALSR